MSAVGMSSARSNTFRPRSAAAQIWLIAAPPAAKVSTICRLTSAGKAETPRSAMPWLPAKSATTGRATIGGDLLCHAAAHSAISSSRPREPPA